MIETSRRSFLGGALALVAAPAIIRVENLMPVKLMLPKPQTVFSIGINQRASYHWVAQFGHAITDGVDKLIEFNIFPMPGKTADAVRYVKITRGADGRLIVPPDVHQLVMTPDGKIHTKFNGLKLKLDVDI